LSAKAPTSASAPTKSPKSPAVELPQESAVQGDDSITVSDLGVSKPLTAAQAAVVREELDFNMAQLETYVAMSEALILLEGKKE